MDETASTLANRLYAAALDNEGWNEALGAVARCFRADMAMLMLVDVDGDRPQRADVQTAYNIAPDAMLEYGSRLARLDPWMRYAVKHMPQMQAVNLSRIIPAESFVNTPPFRHLLNHGIPARHLLTAKFEAPGDGVIGAISLLRRGDSGGFADDTEPLLQELLPHLRRAAGANARLQGADLQGAGMALEAQDQAMALLDAAARPRAMNTVFRRLLAEGWFVQQQGAVAPAEAARAVRFAALVAAAATPHAPAALQGGDLALRHATRPGVLKVRVLPQRRPVASALVMISDPARAAPPGAGMLREAFGLTAAESRLALALLGGATVAEYASRRGLGQPTVRTQLAALFAKTGTSRQAGLVRLLASLSG